MQSKYVLEEVSDERKRQISKGYDSIHDDSMKLFIDFISDIENYTAWCKQMYRMGSTDKARRRMVQIAALAVSAVEYIDRNRMQVDENVKNDLKELERIRNEIVNGTD